jgi:hypothetical protein
VLEMVEGASGEIFQIKKFGALQLKTSAYVLPDEPTHYERFQWLSKEIVDAGGDATAVPGHATPSLARAFWVCVIWVTLWSTPVCLLALWLGGNHTLVQEGLFFSKATLVTFGGAYAVFSLDLPGRPLHRKIARQRSA